MRKTRGYKHCLSATTRHIPSTVFKYILCFCQPITNNDTRSSGEDLDLYSRGTEFEALHVVVLN